MKEDNGQHCIVEHSFGDFSAYACTTENAYAILKGQLHNVYREVRALSDELSRPDTERVRYLTTKLLAKALDEVLTIVPGNPLPLLRQICYGKPPAKGEDLRPEVLCTLAMRQELLMWLFENKIEHSVLKEKEQALAKLTPETALSFLAPLCESESAKVKWVDEWTFDEAWELKVVLSNKWKEEAQEHRVVERILKLANQWSHRDVKYAVSALKANY